jgi:hypothetical protein
MLWNKIRRKAGGITKNSIGNETGGLVHANMGTTGLDEEEEVRYLADKCNAYFGII